MTIGSRPASSSSYTSEISDAPLLRETIGDNFDRTVARDPDREALVYAPTGRREAQPQSRSGGSKHGDALAGLASVPTRGQERLHTFGREVRRLR